MKAPDKICVAPHQIFDCDLEIQEVGHNGAEEYIRKDAILEWAKSQKARLNQGYKHEWKNSYILYGGTLVLDNLIEKIKSL